MHSALEKHAEDVARDLLPDEPQGDGERGIDFIAIITIIMTVIQTIVQNCPKQQDIAASLKKPSLRQLVALLKACKDTCDCTGRSRMAGNMYRTMLAKASALSEVDAKAIVSEASSDANLLV